MNSTLFKALLALLPASALFAGALLLVKARSPRSLLHLLGASCLLLVVAAHICEGLHLLPWMGWGLEHSAGHHLDLFATFLALTLFPVGYVLNAVAGRHQ